MEHNNKLIKLQVKSSTYQNNAKENHNSGYVYSIHRRSRITKNNKVFHYYEDYNDYDCDMFVFVQPRLYKIAFFHVKQIDVTTRKILKEEQFKDYPLKKALTYIKEPK